MILKKIKIEAVKLEEQITHETDNNFKYEISYVISDKTRDIKSELHEIKLGDENTIAEFVFDDDTVWMCDNSNLHQLYPEVSTASRTIDEDFILRTDLKIGSEERGFNDIRLKVVRIFKSEPTETVSNLALDFEDKQFGIHAPGLFKINENFDLVDFRKDNELDLSRPVLLFIHGTASSLTGAYSDLKSTSVWQFIQEEYKNNIIGFQHRTLTESPLNNVLELINLLPSKIKLHIISHSRGGLVGDILCKYDKRLPDSVKGFSEEVHIARLELEGRTEDVKNIRELNDKFKSKEIQVDRFVRVASPSAGTSLASIKLENILNIFLNIIPFSDVNLGKTSLKKLIKAIVKTKDNVDVLPGIEAMNPTSPFMIVLNDKRQEAALDDHSLAVISGNSSIGFSLKGLVAIVTRLFFDKKNDMLVNTDSMYLGVHRKNNIQYFFDQGVNVTHVTYFSKEETLKALQSALKTSYGESIPGFKSVKQYEVPASDRAILEGGHLKTEMPRGSKPIVVMLPGIMGSNIGDKDGTVWINYWQLVTGGLKKMGNLKELSEQSVVKTSYNKLFNRLSKNYDVFVFPFDWRLQLNESAAKFEILISELLKLNQPIKIVAHSMGGVLVRDFILKHPDTWKKLNSSKDFRVLFLGSPLGGSFRIPAVLFGKDPIINTLSTVDLKHTKKQLLKMFSNFPGILSLLPLTTDDNKDFAKVKTWQDMCAAHDDLTWPIPDAKVLKVFEEYRDFIILNQHQIDYTNMVYVAGKDKATPCDYVNFNDGNRKELAILYTSEGDQSVTWESGIPKKMIENDTVYYVPSTHGGLSCDPNLFAGIEEILQTGKTNQFSKIKPITRGHEKLFRSEIPYNFDYSETGIIKTLLGIDEEQQMEIGNFVMSVSVSNGDLKYCSHPIIAGHFDNDGIHMAERAIDNLLQNILAAKHRLGNYPNNIGTNEVCLTDGTGTFKGAIIVGLGEPGELTGHLLSKTVEAGVANYLLEAHHKNLEPDFDKGYGVSSLVVGSEYGGQTIERSIKAIIEGVNKANENVKNIWGDQKKFIPITHIEFIELYEDKALAIMYALGKIKRYENQIYNIELHNHEIKRCIGIQKRLPSSKDDVWWNRINVKMVKSRVNSEFSNEVTYVNSLTFGSSGKDAKEEVNELHTSTSLIDLFIKDMSKDNRWDRQSAATVFELMIPNDIKEKVRQKGDYLWTLDKDSAAYPWELLQDNTKEADPLCISGGMIRRLSTDTYRLKVNVKYSGLNTALVIGDPDTNNFASQLKGAAQEAESVANALAKSNFTVNRVIQKSAGEIVKSLFSDDYKVIHIAAHGFISPDNIKETGIVIGERLFLTPADFNQLGSVPELVFINCCHLADTESKREEEMQDRYKLAANIGTQLIQMGVKAIVAAGWAVQDVAAEEFAQKFYSEMLNGVPFGEAVKQARKNVYKKFKNSNNTWGAYQCYGDPFYTLTDARSENTNSEKNYIVTEQATIELDNMLSRMDAGFNRETIIEEMRLIDVALNKAKFNDAQIIEKQAFVYHKLGDYAEAIKKFEILFKHNNSKYSIEAIEKYCSASIKNCTEQYFNHENGSNSPKIPDIVKQINNIIHILNNIFLLGDSHQRCVILAGAYKRKALMTENEERILNLKLSVIYFHLAAKKLNYNDVFSITNLYLGEHLLKLNDVTYHNNNNKLKIDIDPNLLHSFITQDADVLNLVTRISKESDQRSKLKELNEKALEDARNGILENGKIINLKFCSAIIDKQTEENIWLEILKETKELFNTFNEARKKSEMEHIIIHQYLLPEGHELIDKLKKLKEFLSA